MNTTGSTSTTKAGARARIANRLAMGALDLVGLMVPIGGGLVAAWFIDAQLADSVHGVTRLAYVFLTGIAAVGAVDRAIGETVARPYRRLCGRTNGPRTWSCEHCPATITAAHWSLAEVVVFEEHLTNPAAHDCTGQK